MITDSKEVTAPVEEVVASGYSIEEKENRFIVWRLTADNKYRQGSFDTYDEANERIDTSIENLNC